MNKGHSVTVLVLAIALVTVGIALVSSDDAEAADNDIELIFKDDEAVQMARGRNPNVFNYTITATGTSLSQEVYIKMIDLPGEWVNILYACTTNFGLYSGTFNGASETDLEIMLEKGETARLSVTVVPPFNQLNQTYWFTMNVWPRKDAGNNESHTFGIIVPQKAAFEIVLWNPPPNLEYRAIPPSTVTIRFALFNTGNGVDRFLIKGESSRTDAGWTLEYVSGVNEWGFSPDLTPDPNKRSPHFIDVKVPIPAGERSDICLLYTSPSPRD